MKRHDPNKIVHKDHAKTFSSADELEKYYGGRLQKVQQAELVKKDACIDEPEWVDAQGDACVAYVQAIEKKLLTRKEACGEAPGSENNQDGAAKLHCRATCRTCKPIQHIIEHKPRSLPEMLRRFPRRSGKGKGKDKDKRLRKV